MALAALVNFDRCQTNSTLAALTGAQLDALTNAASSAIRSYTHRDFTQTSYTEYYSGGVYIREPIHLRQYPVTEISRIATANKCLGVTNSGAGGTVQRAVVETLSTGDIQLTSYASGVKTANTVSISSNVTVQAVANAINALGSGWGTSIYAGGNGSYALFPSADLKPLQGAFSAMVGGGFLEIYEDWYGWNTMAYWPDEEYEAGACNRSGDWMISWARSTAVSPAASSTSASTTPPATPPFRRTFKRRACNWRRTCTRRARRIAACRVTASAMRR